MALTVADVLTKAVVPLRAAEIEGARRDARILLGHVIGAGRAMTARDVVSDDEQARFEALIARRAAREPVSRIIGSREFWSRNFRLSAATLDPRPDTETLIDAALSLVASRSAPLGILDLGTGTGCILLALLSELPNARGHGSDASGAAIGVARENAVALGLGARATFSVGDWCRDLSGVFDLIVSNPPYIPSAEIASLEPEVSRFDPRAALDGGPDGLEAYRRIAVEAARHVAESGALLLEVGQNQAPAVEAILAAQGWELAVGGPI